jgi:hypothetical protein
MKYVSPLSFQREVYAIPGAMDVNHSEILTGFYLVEEGPFNEEASPLSGRLWR